MTEFFEAQIDYIFFFYGLGFMVLGTLCFVLDRRGQQGVYWWLLGLFGIVHGLNEWLDLLALVIGDSLPFRWWRFILMTISFGFLLEFARRGSRGWVSLPGGRVVYIPLLLAVILAGELFGLSGANAMARYVLGLVAGLWAGAILLLHARTFPAGRNGWLFSAGGATALYGVATGAIVPTAPFPPASLLNHSAFLQLTGTPIQFWRGLLACWIAVSLWEHFRAATADRSRISVSGRPDYFHWTSAVLLMVLAAGWVGTNHLGKLYSQDLNQEAASELAILGSGIKSEFASLDAYAEALASFPLLQNLLSEADAQTQQQANQALGRYNQIFHASVSFVMNASGVVIASSNSAEAANFVGQNFAFRPYFRNAMTGEPEHYFALGVSTGKRGYYTSYPVRNAQGNIIGVSAVKKDIDPIERNLAQYAYAFLIDPDGVVFLSSRKDMLFDSLWPLPDAVRQAKRASRQFGNTRLDPIFKTALRDGSEIRLQNETYLVARQAIDHSGWSIVLFKPMKSATVNRLQGITITFLITLLILIFFAVLQLEVRNAEKQKQAQDELARLNAELETLATTDRLTGVFNRRKFDELLTHEMVRAKRYGMPLSLIMFDIDHFKLVNDTYGHQVGDEVLQGLALLVAGHVRESDSLARWGGEEFMVMATNSELEDAARLAEKLRELIAQADFGSAGQITCSFGVARYASPETEEQFTYRADAALYRAKAGGRNRVEVDT